MSKKQLSLFDEVEEGNEKQQEQIGYESITELAVIPQVKEGGTDLQIKYFNSRVRDIKALKKKKEKLLADLEWIKKQLKDSLKEGKEELIQLKKMYFEKMYAFLQKKSFNKNERESLAIWIITDGILFYGEFGIRMQKEMKFAYNDVLTKKQRVELEDGLKGMPLFEFSLSDLINLSEEKLAQKHSQKHKNPQDIFDEILGDVEVNEKYEELKEKEKNELLLQQKDFKSLYKSLSKRVHPDLEKDEALKLKKEALMKQLIEANEKKDLHQLLLIESGLNELEGKEDEAPKINNLKQINEILFEQKKELGAEIFRIKKMNPDTAPIFREFYHVKPSIVKQRILAAKQEFMDDLDDFKDKLSNFKSVATVKRFIEEQNNHMESELFHMMMEEFYRDDEDDEFDDDDDF